MDLYILDPNGIPIPEPDLQAWSKWFQTATRRVACTTVGPALISTVFLGLDHNYFGGPPLLFETMIFWKGHSLNNEQARYTTRTEALLGHKAMLSRVHAARAEATNLEGTPSW